MRSLRWLAIAALALSACGPLKILPAKDPLVGRKGPTAPPLKEREGITVLSHEPVPFDESLIPELLPEPVPERSVVGGRTVTEAERRASDLDTARPDAPAIPGSRDLVALPAPMPPAANAPLPEQGGYLYALHCATCHGIAGRGDGPSAAALLYPPADLTRVAERRGGVFIAGDIAGHLDGRIAHPSHGSGEQPIWGPGLGLAEPDAASLASLLSYLESIQNVEAPDEPAS